MSEGTDSQEITYLSIKAQWMMNGGKTEEEWNALPISTVKLLLADSFAREERQTLIIAGGVAKAFSPKKKNAWGD